MFPKIFPGIFPSSFSRKNNNKKWLYVPSERLVSSAEEKVWLVKSIEGWDKGVVEWDEADVGGRLDGEDRWI